MEAAILEIIAALRDGGRTVDAAWLDRLVRRHNRAAHDAGRTVAKRRLLPYYLQVRTSDPARWRSWNVDGATEERLVRLLKMKPRRTASGVATTTVITKPWPCSSDCLYCPSDVRMPKSYLANEPACQRAEHNYFDPYLQVKARLHALSAMGHVTDKVELIVLGGTWNDYPEPYQRWFVRELFRALNDDEPYQGGPERDATAHGAIGATATEPSAAAASATSSSSGVGAPVGQVAARAARYAAWGLSADPKAIAASSEATQRAVTQGELTYNQAIDAMLRSDPWQRAARFQTAGWDELEREQCANEQAARRVVGLVIETRPDLITPEAARTMRRLGCTKVQMGVQSLDGAVLAANRRSTDPEQIARAFAVLRAFGFKIHVHTMVNLLGSMPEADKADYQRLVSDERYCPDEVKLYPCALVASARLTEAYRQGSWHPYDEERLVDVLVADVLATPAQTRISRMVRDISSTDIVAGNRKTNLRQLVEARLRERADEVREIRMREIATDDVSVRDLRLECVRYQTSVAEECFLQWVTPQGRIAGFCRLSLPDAEAVRQVTGAEPPISPTTAVIREVHVYGRVAGLGTNEQGGAQHAGLGKALVEEACRLAREAAYDTVAVISAIGTREYYRTLGFSDAGLYQLRQLESAGAAQAYGRAGGRPDERGANPKA